MNGDNTNNDDSLGKTQSIAFDSHSIVPIDNQWSSDTTCDHRTKRLAEFELRDCIGKGGFSIVYSAFDTTLHRHVAIKIPHPWLLRNGSSADECLREARAIAGLDHPAILPIYQAASSPEIPVYIVTKLIDGKDLGTWHRNKKPSHREFIELMIPVIDAIQYAHDQGIVHRDIKPSNILVDQQGRPFLADFGLALRELDVDSGPNYVGTPAYMSPEQARGEGHRVDGRSDIFSVGIVLYLLLTGKKPFGGNSTREVLRAIEFDLPPEMMLHDPKISRELNRIVLRSLSKPLQERYSRASDLKEDLLAYLQTAASGDNSSPSQTSLGAGYEDAAVAANDSKLPNEGVIVKPSAVVPKGLRPFETRDGDFFLQLVPGPRDRFDLPESIQFWKSRIESKEEHETFSVGVLYGPSGCGKTSLFRAGIKPRLATDIQCIYMEASSENTESKLLATIASTLEIPPRVLNTDDENVGVANATPLVNAMSWIRRKSKRKVVICIDQFEQWLFTHLAELEESELLRALRQCNGLSLQCILMVRDDFWMAITRMMQALDIEISENLNAWSVDLFDKKHARKVFVLFGQSLGKLPQEEHQFSPRQQRFIDAAIETLLVDGRIIPVRLALLAEMLKYRSWDDLDLLQKDAGVGIGLYFLEQTFDSENTPKRFQRHAEGAQRVLRKLLPESAAKIKGSFQPESELWDASGYRERSHFRDLLRILDNELHLILPTERSESDSMSRSSMEESTSSSKDLGYQLTHDFLIAPTRTWLAKKQLGTRLGQAQLRLEEFADLYKSHPSRQMLPTLAEYLALRSRLPSNGWTESQKKMMRVAQQHHLLQSFKWLALGVGVVAMFLLGWNRLHAYQNAQMVAANVERFMMAEHDDAITFVRPSSVRNEVFEQLVAKRFEAPSSTSDERFRASMFLAPSNQQAQDYFLIAYLQKPINEVIALVKNLPLEAFGDAKQLTELWKSKRIEGTSRLRLAAIFAQHGSLINILDGEYDPIALLLTEQNPIEVQDWIEIFKPVGNKLLGPVESLFLNNAGSESVSALNAANILANYGSLDSANWSRWVAVAEPTTMTILINGISTKGGLGSAGLDVEDRSYISDVGEASDRFWNKTELDPIDINRANAINSQFGTPWNRHFTTAIQMTEEAFNEHTRRLEEFGYRVAVCCPYKNGDKISYAGLWKRDGRKSIYETNCTSHQLREIHSQNLAKGYFVDEVVAYMVTADECRFACTWCESPPFPGVIESDMYVDIPLANHQTEGWQRFVEKGFIPRSNILVHLDDGQEFFTSVRWRFEKPFLYHDDWNLLPNDFDRLEERFENDQRLLVEGRWSVRSKSADYHGITDICWDGTGVDSRYIKYSSVDKHNRRAFAMMLEGFRPWSMDAFVDEADGAQLKLSSIWARPKIPLDLQLTSARRAVRLAIGNYLLGDNTSVKKLLNDNSDANRRGLMIDACHRFKISSQELVDWMKETENPYLRRGAAMALTLYPQETLSPYLIEECKELSDKESKDSDQAFSAIIRNWLASRGSSKNSEPAIADDTVTNNSVADNVLIDMVDLYPPEEITIGSSVDEPKRDGWQEARHSIRLRSPYQIGRYEVTVADYRRFDSTTRPPSDYAPDDRCPMIQISWFDAAKYCRWLSEQAGIEETEMCFPPISEIAPGMKLPDNYLDRTGYRLPTEAEWEYAARGGCASSRYLGFSDETLELMAWTAKNSNFVSHPIGKKLPNDYGLFDMLGNAMEWTCSPYKGYPQDGATVTDQTAQYEPFEFMTSVSTRGGAFLFQSADARASHRNDHNAGEIRVYLSVRIAKTLNKSNESN